MRPHQSNAPEQVSDATSSDPPLIAVKAQTVDMLRKAAGWSTAELARRACLDQSAVARLLRGDLRPGPRSIGGLLLAFSGQFPRIGFYDLFELISEDGTILTPQVDDAATDGAAVAKAMGKVS